MEVVLFVEDEHGFLVVDGVNRAEAQRAIAVGYQDGIACDAGSSLVAVGEGLDV